MEGFRTSRALVIDDIPAEAIPVIQALGSMGIASIYHDASPDAVYSKKHTGMRLLFLDMVLTNRSASESDPEGAANALTGALGQLIELSNEPVVAVCWTRHPDFKEDFQKAFSRVFPNTPLACVLTFKKEDFSDPAKQQELVSQIEQALEALSPFSFLFSWEQMVHNAATRTTTRLAKLIQLAAADGKIPWTTCAYQVCAALALAERGRRLVGEKAEHALAAFHDSLTPLLADQLDHMGLKPATGETLQENPASEHQAASSKQEFLPHASSGPTAFTSGTQATEPPLAEQGSIALTPAQMPVSAVHNPVSGEEQAEAIEVSEEAAAKLLQAAKEEAALWEEKKSLLSSTLRAGLNTMFLTSNNVGLDAACPGYIYAINNTFIRAGDIQNPNLTATKQCLSCWTDVGPDTFVIDSKFPYDHIPVLVEITPSCDFAQDKSKLPRFVAGYLFPEAGVDKLRRTANHVRAFGPLLLRRPTQPRLDGVYFLVFNAHFLPSLNKSIVKQMKPFMRLRTGVLADLVAWVSEQSSRPGYTSIGP
jgi:hypothetical protein